ncbi:MAG: EamA family transporter [Candidatus Paceibacterota bacterium]|jgi:uncharacterized membrane protein
MWFYSALLMSFFSGIYVVVSKHTLKNMDPIVFFWATITASTLFVSIPVLINGIPRIDLIFVFSVFASTIIYIISKIIFWKTIKKSLLSDVYPLISIGPVFTLIFSVIFFSEKLSFFALLGSGITLFGTYILNVSSIREGLLKPFKILFQNKLSLLMLVSIFIGSVVIIFDKISINHIFPQDLFFVLFIEDLIIIIGLLPWMMINRKIAVQEIKVNLKFILLLGFVFTLSSVIAFFALSKGNPGLVSSVFRTQIFFVFLFGFLFFKDRPKLEAVLGTIIMILGLVVLKLGS